MQHEDAHEALFARVDRSLVGASNAPVVAPVVDAVAVTLADARTAAKHLLAADTELQLLHARRFSYLLADLAEGAFLLDEATWSLARDGDARKAVIARRFATRHLVPPRVRGILDDDRTVIDLFEPLVRYGSVDESAAA
jgi:predicted nucleic acid-binding protein